MKRSIYLQRREGREVAIKGRSGGPNISHGDGILVRPGQELLVRLNVQEEKQIMDIDTDGINFSWIGCNKGFGVGVQNRSEGIKNEACMVSGDLQDIGDGG